uniref:Uncharacterized protein n=1 Tax=Anguilla anguilla TaxID=7936 RepID=A0A0E9WDW3_ANGAN
MLEASVYLSFNINQQKKSKDIREKRFLNVNFFKVLNIFLKTSFADFTIQFNNLFFFFICKQKLYEL